MNCLCGWPLHSDGTCLDAECSYGWDTIWEKLEAQEEEEPEERSTMKSISFDKQSIDAILEGRKTVTRRLAQGKPCRYRVGETLYVSERWRQPEKDARLFVEVVSVRREPMRDITAKEIHREGYQFDGQGAYPWWKARWNSIHTEPGTRFEDNPEVYRIEFRVVKS